jgi:uncharacterized protein
MQPFQIDVADLLGRPGARRPVRLEVPADGFDVGTAHVDAPVVLDLVLERVADGIVVHGSVHAHWESECSVCLAALESDIDVSVDELFEPGPVEGETYPLDGHVIDVEQLLRDSVLLDLPLVTTCATLGLRACTPVATPGVTIAEPPEHVPDPRWSALSELEL